MPQNYKDRKDVMIRGIDTVRRLWRGGVSAGKSGNGDGIEVRIFPSPVQREPQIWLTAAGNIETFRMAGELGANILTNLFGQKVGGAWREDCRLRAACTSMDIPVRGTSA